MSGDGVFAGDYLVDIAETLRKTLSRELYLEVLAQILSFAIFYMDSVN
jgi:hypothetical protein